MIILCILAEILAKPADNVIVEGTVLDAVEQIVDSSFSKGS